MYLYVILEIWLYKCFSLAICGSEVEFGIEIPKIHTVEEAFKSFEHEPKIGNVTELGEEMLRSASNHIGEVKTISGKCLPDFSEPCPEGWEQIGEFCKATSSYKGLCKTMISFKSYTPEQKINWSNSCQANWPCKKENKNNECSDSERNYNQVCPMLFVKEKSKDSDNYICVPDLSTYVGPCNSLVDFSDFSKESKRLWAESCGTHWPCMKDCSFVFEDCPMDWVKDSDGSCNAPPSYKGSCDKSFFFTHYTQKMKLEYLKGCDIAFECTNDCKKDYDKCPNNWVGSSNGTCTIPKFDKLCFTTYSELSGLKNLENTENENKFTINLKSLSYDKKVLFESRCSLVNFPCSEEDEYNWSEPCPKGWNLLNNYCTPLYIDQNDDCKSKKIFNSEEDKRKWSSFCQIEWPKVNESTNEPEIVHIQERKFSLNGPIIHETGGVNVITDTNFRSHEVPREVDYSQNIKKLKRTPNSLNF